VKCFTDIPWTQHPTRKQRSVELTHEQALMACGKLDHTHADMMGSGSWNGGTDSRASLKLLATGDLASVTEAEAMLSQLDLHVESPHYHPEAMPVGCAPRVGAFMAGDPCDMMGRRRDDMVQGPIRVYVSMVSSGGIDDADLRKRGIACLAIVMALAQQRPVELWGLVASHPYEGHMDTVLFFPMCMTPLDLARVAAYIGRSATARNLFYGLAYDLADSTRDGSLGWPETPEGKLCEEHAAGTPHILIPGPFYDQIRELSNDAKGWCEKHLKLALEAKGAGFDDNAAKCREMGE